MQLNELTLKYGVKSSISSQTNDKRSWSYAIKHGTATLYCNFVQKMTQLLSFKLGTWSLKDVTILAGSNKEGLLVAACGVHSMIDSFWSLTCGH